MIISFFLFIYIIFRNIEYCKLKIKKNKKIFFLIFFTFFFLIVKISITILNIDTSTYDQIKDILDKQTGSIFINFYIPFFIFSCLYYFLFSDFFNNNFFLFCRLINFILIILLSISLVNYLYIDILNASHRGFFNPHIYLFFFDDNLSSKNQHAYLIFLINIILVHNFFEKKNFFDFLLIILNLFFSILIFSKLFILAIYGYLILYLFFNFKKGKLKSIIGLISCSIILVIIFSSFVKFTTNKHFNIFFSTITKFGSSVSSVNKEYYNKAINEYDIFLKQKEETYEAFYNFKLSSTPYIVDYYDSTNQRIQKLVTCVNVLGHPDNIFDIVDVNNLNLKLKKRFQILFGDQRYVKINCENTFVQIAFLDKFFSAFVILFFLFNLIFFYYKKNYQNFIIFFSIILVGIAHNIFDNPATYIFLTMIFSNYFKIKSA